LIVTAKTGYSVNAMSATVQINGRTVGVIDPRPWVNHNFFALEAIILPFSARILTFNESNRLQIVRVPPTVPPDPNNFVQSDL
jgi:hypothetical protein